MRSKIVCLFTLLFLHGLLDACGRSAFSLRVVFPDSQGLKSGASVCYRGVEVGRVAAVSIQPFRDQAPSEVVVELSITNKDARVREQDRILTRSVGLLGDKMVEIVPGPPTAPLVSSGSTMRGETGSLLEGASTFTELLGLSSKVSALPLKKRDTLLGTFQTLADQAAIEREKSIADPKNDTFPYPQNGFSSEGPGTSVEALGWLAGCWEEEGRGRQVVEQWMRPAGESMLGISRTVSEEKTVAYEFMRIITQEDGNTYFVAKPSGQKEAAFKLIRMAAQEAVFENREHDFPQRIIYRSEKDGSLLARIEGVSAGKGKGIDFSLKRIKCD